MDKFLNNFDKLFKRKVEDLEDLPLDNNLWTNIEKELDKDDANKYKKKFILFRALSVCLFFLLIGFITFNYIGVNSTKAPITNTSSSNNSSANGSNKSAIYQHRKTAFNNAGQLNKNISSSPAIVASEDANDKITSISRVPVINSSHVDIATASDLITTYSNPVQSELTVAGLTDELLDVEHPQPVSLFALNAGLPILSSIDIGLSTSPSAGSLVQPTYTKNEESATGKSSSAEIKKIITSLKKPLSVTLLFAPQFAGYQIDNDEANMYDNRDKILKREKKEFSFDVGLMLTYPLKKNWYLQSGLAFSSSSIVVDPSIIFAEKITTGDVRFRYNTSSGYSFLVPSFTTSPAVGDSIRTQVGSYILQNISVPVLAKYLVNKGRYFFGGSAGVSFNFLTRARVETEVQNFQNEEKETFSHLSGLRTLSASFILAPEFQYSISKKFNLTAQPSFNYSFTAINKNNIVKTYPYFISMGVGLRYKL